MSANAATSIQAPDFPRLLAPLEPPAPLPRGRRAREELIDAVAASGLTGRGGAGFPTAVKLRAVADSGHRPVVMANGVEGEPPSAKDKFLLERNPHLVLDGALAAADPVGAQDIYIALADGAALPRARIAGAIDARADAIEARRDMQARFHFLSAPDRFIAGEESALVQFANGGQAKPAFVPPRPFERGVGGRPTLVQNVETLANIGLIARHGPDWFRQLGTESEPGTALVTVAGAVRRRASWRWSWGLLSATSSRSSPTFPRPSPPSSSAVTSAPGSE